tara:strand:+ start:208 stop:735 length:528 start_codon:yes stop_codon:yes gene_type:complete
MAIKDMKGTVSTTGMVNAAPPKIEAPDMSNMKMPAGMAKDKPKQIVEKPVPQNTPREEGLLQRVENLTNEDKNLLSTFLSPSVTTVLSKVAPEIEPLLKQFAKDEENVVLPVSIVKNFASRKYPGTEQESIQSFVSDLAGQMEQSKPVPPDTQMVQAPESDVNYDAIDSDTMAIS